MYDTIARIQRSKTMLGTLKILNQTKAKPSQIAKKLNVHLSSCSRSMAELQKEGLIECLTPKQPNFRYYKITTRGKKIIKILKKLDEFWKKELKTSFPKL